MEVDAFCWPDRPLKEYYCFFLIRTHKTSIIEETKNGNGLNQQEEPTELMVRVLWLPDLSCTESCCFLTKDFDNRYDRGGSNQKQAPTETAELMAEALRQSHPSSKTLRIFTTPTEEETATPIRMNVALRRNNWKDGRGVNIWGGQQMTEFKTCLHYFLYAYHPYNIGLKVHTWGSSRVACITYKYRMCQANLHDQRWYGC